LTRGNVLCSTGAMTAIAEAVDGTVRGESNTSFASKVGCNHTMASRLRSGQRMPSAAMLGRICDAYHLDKSVALTKYAEGRDIFSAWLREHVFGDG
jgi:transcriptional regulator with XRE-family HTH domain